jgi:hypothetical protein
MECLSVVKYHLLQKEYKKDLELEIKGKGMQVGTDTIEIQRARKAAELASEVSGVRPTDSETTFLELNKSYQQLISAWDFSKLWSCFDSLEWKPFQIILFV